MAIFTHVTVGTNDLAKARSFYDSVLGALGYKRLKDFGDGGSCWGQTTEEFMVLKPADGKPAAFANGGIGVEGWIERASSYGVGDAELLSPADWPHFCGGTFAYGGRAWGMAPARVWRRWVHEGNRM